MYSYVAKRLAIELSGQATLNTYRGRPRNVAHKSALDNLVDAYIDRKRNEAQQDVLAIVANGQEVEDLIDLVEAQLAAQNP